MSFTAHVENRIIIKQWCIRMNGVSIGMTVRPKKFTAVKNALLEIPKAELTKKKKRAAKPKSAAAKKPAKKKEKPEQHPPRAVPRKPKPKKLIARRGGKKGKRKK